MGSETASPSRLLPGPGFRVDPVIAGDGAGGAFVVWREIVVGGEDLFAQHVDADGDLLWLADGVSVCSFNGAQINHRMVWNGSALLVAWEDHRATANSDIYANSVTGPRSTSVPGRPAPGQSFRVRMLSANPFRNSEARLAVELPEAGWMEADLYDSGGRRVRRIAAEERPAGDHVLHWDGRDESGDLRPSGVYFLRVEAGSRSSTVKVGRMR